MPFLLEKLELGGGNTTQETHTQFTGSQVSSTLFALPGELLLGRRDQIHTHTHTHTCTHTHTYTHTHARTQAHTHTHTHKHTHTQTHSHMHHIDTCIDARMYTCSLTATRLASPCRSCAFGVCLVNHQAGMSACVQAAKKWCTGQE